MTALIALAMLADLVTFAAAVPIVGIGAEQNPIMAAGYASHGLAVIAALKLAALAAIVLLVARVNRPRLRRTAAAIAIAVGVVGAASNVTAWAAASRPAQHSGLPHPSGSVMDGSVLSPDFTGRTGAPLDPDVAQLAERRVSRMSGHAEVAGAEPVVGANGGAPPRTAITLRGIASFVAPGYGAAYLALPGGAGQRATICGPAACITRTSTDAGPDRAMQRANRIADVSWADFRVLCRCDPYAVGLIRVTVTLLPDPPDTSMED